ncbi:MAG: hypothetical protein HY690_00580 [Chloroflexi bacterium]|nr:hypothetical protein [Chloroflexota bacterium]
MARSTWVAEAGRRQGNPLGRPSPLDGRPQIAKAPASERLGLLARPGVRAALLVAPLLFLVFYNHFFANTDPDYWWHVRTGQYIYETGTLPRQDLYSYTAVGHPWVTHEWLTELLFYVVQQQMGYVGNVALFGLVGAFTWLAVYATCRRRGVGELGALVLLLWGFGLAIGSANVRPQALTTLLLALSALLLTRYKQGHPRALWLFPPLFALWVNLHGGYIIGLALLGLTVLGEAIALARRQPVAPLRPLVAVAALSALATLLNPHGFEALLYPFTYAGSANASMRYIVEWQSPDFHQPYFLLFAGSLLLSMALGLARRPLGATEALWMLGFALMALQSVRHMALYAVVATPLLGARLQAEVPTFRRSLAALQRPRLIAFTLPLVVAGAAVLLPARAAQDGTGPQFGWEPSPATYPSGAVAYLRAHDPGGNLFNEYGWGGYLVYQLYPQRRVFVDGRADVYGDALLDTYWAVVDLRPGWRQTLDRHDVRLVLVKKESFLAVALQDDPAWEEVFVGPVERLFARRTS